MKNEMTRRILSLALAMLLVFSLAACSGNSDPTEAPATEAPTEAPATEAPTEAPTEDNPSVENAATYVSLNMAETANDTQYMMVYDNYDGTVHVEYASGDKKVADMDAALMNDITAALNDSGLIALNGQDNYGEGEASASMYIEFADGTSATVNYSGTIPQEFTDGYNAMVTFFQTAMADVPVYVPQLQIMDGANADAVAALQEIMNNTGIKDLDQYMVSDVAKDEFFAMNLGLSSDAGIATATTCNAMIMTNPYGISLVTLEDGADAQAIIADFEANLNWGKFVCVRPSNAVIAQKDNMVLCFMGSDELFTKTAAAIQASGWTVVKELNDPGV